MHPMGDIPSPQPPPDQPAFEEILRRLEDIVHLLEEGEIGLSEALAQYEEGVKLLRQSYELLERAERRIELLCGVDAGGNPITAPFDDTATFSPGEAARPQSRRSRPQPGPAPQREGGTDVDEPGSLF